MSLPQTSSSSDEQNGLLKFLLAIPKVLWDLANEATKNVKKAPGWVPLAVTCLALFWYMGVPPDFEVLGFSVSRELFVLLATVVLYVLGESLDSALFEDLTKGWPGYLEHRRAGVKNALHLKTGYYQVSRDLAVAAEEYEGTRIQVKNETAKFARSLLFLTFAFSVALLWYSQLAEGLVFLLLTLALFGIYFWLKIGHMCNLYDLVKDKLVKDEKYQFHDLGPSSGRGSTRMFFWEGRLVSSGLPLDR
jgi:hypothetical protein